MRYGRRFCFGSKETDTMNNEPPRQRYEGFPVLALLAVGVIALAILLLLAPYL